MSENEKITKFLDIMAKAFGSDNNLADDENPFIEIKNFIEKQQKEIEVLKDIKADYIRRRKSCNAVLLKQGYISKDKIKQIINKYVDIEEHLKYTSQELFGEDLKNMIIELLGEEDE